MGRFDKYIDCEFGYPIDGRIIHIVYTGSQNAEGQTCCNCQKKLFGNAHFFTETEEQSQWVFGGECVKKVFGAGLKTMK